MTRVNARLGRSPSRELIFGVRRVECHPRTNEAKRPIDSDTIQRLDEYYIKHTTQEVKVPK